MRNRLTLLLVAALAPATPIPTLAQVQQGTSTAAAIASAMTAAPKEIAAHATITRPDANGKMTTLRAGTNGWMCLPDDPETPAPDPMCVDKTWQSWFGAYMEKKPPTLTQIGIAYMLAGSADASNTDPYAKKPAAGQKWIMTPAHIMVILPDPKLLDSYPSEPSTSMPYVMWKGTPYAHLMVPTAR